MKRLASLLVVLSLFTSTSLLAQTHNNLTVDGPIKIIQGAADGKVLTSDGDGVATWQTVAANAKNWLGTSASASIIGTNNTLPGMTRGPVAGDEWCSPISDSCFIHNGSLWNLVPMSSTLSKIENNLSALNVNASTDFYPPLMTTTQRDTLTPSVGALIFNTTTLSNEEYKLADSTITSVTHIAQLSEPSGQSATVTAGFFQGQTFTMQGSGVLDKVIVKTNSCSTPGDFNFNLYSGSGVSGTLLKSDVVALNSGGIEHSLNTASVPFEINDVFTLELTPVSTGNCRLKLDVSDVYPGGTRLINGSSASGDLYFKVDVIQDVQYTYGWVSSEAQEENSSSAIIGDIKSGYQTSDHEGWIKLDGRAKSTLTASQQVAATSLGFGTSIPNAEDRIIKQKGAVNSTGGNNSVYYSGSPTLWTEIATGANNGAVSVGSGAVSLNVENKYITANSFVYLGL